MASETCDAGAKVRVAIIEAGKLSCPVGDCGLIVVCEWLAPKSSEGAGGKGRGDAMDKIVLVLAWVVGAS